MNVTSNFTEAFLKAFPQTKYEIEVNGFNEIGHGPASEVLRVKSLAIGRLGSLALVGNDYHIVSIDYELC